jgi:hypothetical protein
MFFPMMSKLQPVVAPEEQVLFCTSMYCGEYIGKPPIPEQVKELVLDKLKRLRTSVSPVGTGLGYTVPVP